MTLGVTHPSDMILDCHALNLAMTLRMLGVCWQHDSFRYSLDVSCPIDPVIAIPELDGGSEYPKLTYTLLVNPISHDRVPQSFPWQRVCVQG